MNKRFWQWSVAACAALAGAGALTGCGGGGSSNSAASAQQMGAVNLQVTDGPSDEFQHVWVTFTAISFHTDPNASWNPADATWKKVTLSAPTTVDLTTLNNGVLNSLFANQNLPVGSYRQIRFLLDGPDAPLDASALSTQDSNGAALQWNDQVEYLGGSGGTTALEAPLEIAYPTQGIQLVGSFNVTPGGTLNLAVDFDLEHSIVPFNHDGLTYFTMRPNLTYFDMSQVAAISGSVNPAALCPSIAAEASQATPCAFNLIVKAERLTADGSRHAVVRQTTVDPATGAFTLFPLATQDASGNPITSYDVLIRGRNMETMLVQSVPVTAGTSPNGTGAAAATSLQSSPIALTINRGEYTAQFATPLAPLSSGYAIFQQTLAGGVPYEVRWRNTDPFTGTFRNPIPLQGSTSSLHVAPYNAGNALAFAGQLPAEGAGAFAVAENEAVYYTLGSGPVMQPVAAGAAQTFVPGVPLLASGVQSGTINATLSFSGIAVDNRCELALARFATIVDTYDCSSLLSTNGGSNGGTFALTGVPAGSSATAVPGATYYAYVRLWESGHGALTRRVVPLPGFIDLRSGTSATLNGSVPGA